jgi:predicted PurR-regulated permease PerM
LLVFLLAPLVNRLVRAGWNNVIAVAAAVSVAFVLLSSVGVIVGLQLYDLAQQLPEYRGNIQSKVRKISSQGGSFLATKKFFERATVQPAPKAAPTEAVEQKPVPVEIHTAEPTSLEVLTTVSASLFGPLTAAGVVAVLVIFMLVQREDIRDRFLLLLGANTLNVSTKALEDAGQRVSRYLLMQIIVNVTYGVPIGAGLYFIGVPNALVWGVLATLLRFIPYLGPIIASILPIALAFAVDPGWSKPMMTIGLFVVIELISNNLVEPWLYANNTGISPLAIIVAAVFWTWLWGPVGLFLSTPLTVCLAVMGRYVPSLRFLHVILGTDAALSDEARFYQRLLARDPEGTLKIAETVVEKKSLAEFYEETVVPALSLAEHDRHEGSLDQATEDFVADNIRDILDEMEKGDAVADDESISALCIPASDTADELCAIMLVQLLEQKRIQARALSVHSLTSEYFDAIRKTKPSFVCVSALPPAAFQQARMFCKKLRREFPEVKIILGVWTKEQDVSEMSRRATDAGIEHLVTSLNEAVNVLASVAAPVAVKEPALA